MSAEDKPAATLPAARIEAAKDPVALKVLTAFLVACSSVMVVTALIAHGDSLRENIGTIVAWCLAFALLNLLDIPNWNGLFLTTDVPVGVAIAVLFHPLTAGLLAFIGSFDADELRGRKPLVRALFNRSNHALGVALSALCVRPFLHATPDLFSTAVACAVAQVVWTIENHLLAATGASLSRHLSFSQALRMFTLGKPVDYLVTNFAWLLIGILLVVVYGEIGLWAVVAFSLIAILVRQMLVRSDSVLRKEAQVEYQKRALAALSNRITSERRDERLRVASHLHDEVIQSLYHVSLLAQVAQRDLTTGRLLELDNDLPALASAAEAAGQIVREAVRDLRNSPVGVRGLVPSLKSLVADFQSGTTAAIDCRIGKVPSLDPGLELALYQICKEALTNAVHHAKARTICILLAVDDAYAQLTVEDDGVGFDQALAPADHFGLLIMEERAESIGGRLYIDSSPGSGTTVTGHFPRRREAE